jgi:hypothetical protein
MTFLKYVPMAGSYSNSSLSIIVTYTVLLGLKLRKNPSGTYKTRYQ